MIFKIYLPGVRWVPTTLYCFHADKKNNDSYFIRVVVGD